MLEGVRVGSRMGRRIVVSLEGPLLLHLYHSLHASASL